MAKMTFYYASMNAGKSTSCIQAGYNYLERGLRALMIKPEVDNRDDTEKVSSRVGLSAKAVVFDSEVNLTELVLHQMKTSKVSVVLVDEAQFLTPDQVKELSDIADFEDIPVVCYGLRTDFQGELFPGSAALMARSDRLKELIGVCHCGKTAHFVLRRDDKGQVVKEGEQILIGGNDRYEAVCRKHHRVAMLS
jgi:thymidine kinase